MSEVRLFRKRPVVIQALRFSRDRPEDVALWCGGRVIGQPKPSDPSDVYVALEIPTLEGVMRAEHGDWIIRGVKGEFYPCKPDIFDATYEPVDP